MAAGEGKRMNSNIPKVLHKFNDIPILVRIINESLKLNPKKIFIITGKYDLLIKDTISQYINNVNIIYIKQNIPLGTGDAIKSTLEFYSDEDNVLILNGDMPLISSNLLNNFIENNDESKILVANLENPFGYGRIIYNSNNDFIGIKEEKDCNEIEKNISTINVGIYLFSSKILKKYILMIDNNNKQNEYYLTDIIKILFQTTNIKIKTHLVNESIKYQILGVNTQNELKELEIIYNNFNIFDK
jgi:bifunctional UDP-N-acetylglucosamine pyrophosphorylase/glucosamine-1-phosphate N-acetyltransferase